MFSQTGSQKLVVCDRDLVNRNAKLLRSFRVDDAEIEGLPLSTI